MVAKVVQGLSQYQESTSNGVSSKGRAGTGANAFEFMLENREKLCPNLRNDKISFLSFSEIVQKVKLQKLTNSL